MSDILPLGDFPLVRGDHTTYPSLDMIDWGGEVLKRIGGLDGTIEVTAAQVTNGEFADAQISQSSVTQHQSAFAIGATQINAGTFADARISQSSVTQHQAAFTFSASQVTAGEFASARISEASVTQHALPKPTVNAQTGTAYTMTSSDRFMPVTMNNAAANTVTIPTGLGGWTDFYQLGLGATTIQGDTGVTVNGTSGGSIAISAQFGHVRAQNIGTNEWVVG